MIRPPARLELSILAASGGCGFDDFLSMSLHVVREHHYNFAVVADIHKATIKWTVYYLYNCSLEDRDRNIPGISPRNRQSGMRETKHLPVFQINSFYTRLQGRFPMQASCNECTYTLALLTPKYSWRFLLDYSAFLPLHVRRNLVM
jgi:hypothetical protein